MLNIQFVKLFYNRWINFAQVSTFLFLSGEFTFFVSLSKRNLFIDPSHWLYYLLYINSFRKILNT